MKLTEIKSRLIEAFFSSKGDGLSESELAPTVQSLAKLIELDPADLLESADQEFDDSLTSYRQLSKGDAAMGYICEGNNVLFVMVRKGKNLACIRLTARNKVERHCTFRDVREAFNEASELDGNVVFKTCYIN